jgi:NTP pyrophosphatase (non-canonical NTP hydrolase)
MSDKIVKEILTECKKQDVKWGADRHLPKELWSTVLLEEVGEVARAILEERAAIKELEQVLEERITIEKEAGEFDVEVHGAWNDPVLRKAISFHQERIKTRNREVILENLREELLQTAAVCVQFIKDLDSSHPPRNSQ